MSNAKNTLIELTDKALLERVPVEAHGVYRKQLDYELGIIEDLGFNRIFMICYELCRFARERNIRMGPGRGSAAASVICWLLDITELDPIRYKLDFSRFLVEGRISPPDIDLDMERSGRERVMARLKEIVGEDKVCKINTFQYMHEKGALRNVARVLVENHREDYLGLEIEINKLAKMVPDPFEETFAEFVERPEIARYYRKWPNLFKLTAHFIGLPRHRSVHAAGVLISSRPLIDVVPLDKDDLGVHAVTQWDMRDAERLGLFKLDLLVLDALDFITEACELAGVEVRGLEPNDPKVFEAFAAGHIRGIFQFDKEYVGKTFARIGCDSFDDIVATNALLRPGAKATNTTDAYVANKRSGKHASSLPGAAKECVSDTYGLLLYQEQAMKIARVCAGFTIAEADDLRKGIAKDYDTSRMKGKFLSGCHRAGLSSRDANKLWHALENAGGYMFNKAHSTCYSYISYQMMWLKVYHPKAFWVALLNTFLDDPPKLTKMAKRISKEQKTKVLMPSANRSRARCWYDRENDQVLLGFLSLSGIGEKAAIEMENLAHEAHNLDQWNTLADRRLVNTKAREELIKRGVFKCWSMDEKAQRDLLLSPKVKERGPVVEEIYPKEEETQQPSLFPTE